MPLDPLLEKNALDWCFGGASPSAPAGAWIMWATSSPNSTSAFDGPVVSRRTVTFAGANSPQGSKTNLNAITATATAACTLVGFNIYDASSGGTRIAWGTLTASLGCASADLPAFAAGAIKITLS